MAWAGGCRAPCARRALSPPAAAQDLGRAVERGAFRKDLFYRLNTHSVHVPPLRERQDDLPLLVASFVEEVARGRDRGVVEVGDDVVPLLSRHSFPGNVRELRSMIFDAVYRVQDHVLTASDFKSLPGTVAPRAPAAESVPDVAFGGKLPQLKEVGDLLVAEALRRTAGNQSKAAGLLGVSHQALSKRLRSGNRQDQSR